MIETMDSHPDIRIFRNFSKLNLQNLIFLQAELLHLQKGWHETVLEDLNSGDPAQVALHFNVGKMMREDTGIDNEKEEATMQGAKFQEIRSKLAEYSER